MPSTDVIVIAIRCVDVLRKSTMNGCEGELAVALLRRKMLIWDDHSSTTVPLIAEAVSHAQTSCA